MEEFGGLKGNFHQGVFFSEQSCSASTLAPIRISKNGQNFTLETIKNLMAAQAKAVGANAIVEFRYGQKSHKWYQQLQLKWDNMEWFGEGKAVSLQ